MQSKISLFTISVLIILCMLISINFVYHSEKNSINKLTVEVNSLKSHLSKLEKKMGKDGDLIIKMREKLRHTKLLYKNDYDSYIALIDSYTELQQILKDERKEYESLLQDYNTKKKRLQ